MSSTKARQLYNYVPGFKNDKDEEWACYLPAKDQMFLRKSRKHYLILMDRLDGLKLELKDQAGDAEHSERIATKIKELTKQIDDYIATILIQIPDLKNNGIQAREKCIEEDLDARHTSTSRVEPSLQDESEVLDSFGAFMPRTSYDEPPLSTTEEAPASSERDQEHADTDQPRRDTYLDNVESENVEIMAKLRPLVERFKCKNHVLEAIRRIRHRDDRLDSIERLKALEVPKHKAIAAPSDKS
jgi:hypothetical protein